MIPRIRESFSGLSGSVVRTSLATLMLRGASFGIRVMCLLVVARKAGPQLFGTVSILLTMAEVARVVADCGLDTLMLRHMATERGRDLARSMGAALCAKALIGGLIGAGLLVAMFRVSPATPLLNALIGLLALTPLMLNFGANYFIATQQTALVSARVVAITVGAVVLFLATTLMRSPVVLGVATVAAYELVLGSWLVGIALRTANIHLVLSWRRALHLLSSSLPLGIAIAAGYTYGKLDIFVLKHFSGTEAVGQYSFWVRLLDPFLFLCGVVAVTAYGHLSAAVHEGDAGKTMAIARRYVALNLIISGSVALGLALAGRALAGVLFPDYAPTAWIGRLLALLLLLRSVNAILTACIQAAGRRRLIMLVSLMNLAVALLACVSLGSVAGALGVISGLLLMESLNFVVQLTFARAFLVPASPSLTGA